MLKSGGQIESLANYAVDRVERAAAINLVIVWCIRLMTQFGRVHPEQSPNLLFSEFELKALKALVVKYRYQPPEIIARAVLIIAHPGC